jgi:prepilin-type processing-associated H-X9-DG protein
MATAAVCLANLNGLSKGWHLYANDYDGKIVGGFVDDNVDPDNSWVERPSPDNAGIEEKERAIMAGALFPYIEATDAYHCPGDRRILKPRASDNTGYGGYRSYSIVGGLKGVGSLSNGWRGWQVYAHTSTYEIKSPGDKYVFVEEADGRGVNMGSWVIHPKPTAEWVDPMTIWHNGRSTLGFCDGHAERMIWKDKSTFDMSENQTFYQNVYATDSGDDLRYMVRNYPFDRPDGW